MDELSKVFESVADYFGLLSEPARLRILHSLCDDELSVNDIVERTGLTQANTSRHLNMLYRARIVDRRRDGSQVFYWICDPNFKDMCRTVCVAIAARGDVDQPRRATLRRLEEDLAGKAD